MPFIKTIMRECFHHKLHIGLEQLLDLGSVLYLPSSESALIDSSTTKNTEKVFDYKH